MILQALKQTAIDLFAIVAVGSVPAAIKGNYVRESATCDSEVCRKEYQRRWQFRGKKRVKHMTVSRIAFGA